MLDEIPGLCLGFQKGYTYAEKTSDHSSSDRRVEIGITKVEIKTKGNKRLEEPQKAAPHSHSYWQWGTGCSSNYIREP